MADFEFNYKFKPDTNSVKQGAAEIAKAMGISGEQAAEAFAKGFSFDKNGRLRDELGRYVTGAKRQLSEGFDDAGKKSGKQFGESFKTGFGGVKDIVAGLGIANLASEAFSFIKSSAQASIELDKQVKNIGTLGVANFEEFAQRATDLSKTVPDSAANIAGAVYDAISAGISGTNDEIMDFVATASKAGVAGMTDTGVAVNGLTSIINAYKLPVSDAAKVSDEFFAGVKLGKLTFEEFVAGVGEAVPTAAALGVGFNELSASVATITSQGVKAPQAFTKMNQLMIELQKPGVELAKTMKGVSVEIGGVKQTLTASNIGEAIKAQGLTKTLQDIEQSARASGKSMTQVFSSSEASAASLLLTGKNADFANKMLKNLNDEVAKGAANAAFQVANTSIENQFKLLQNNLQAALQPIFANILPVLGEVAGQIVAIFQNPAITEAFKTLTIIITQLLKSVIPPLMDILAPLLLNMISYMRPIWEGLSNIITALLPALSAILQPIIAMLPQLGNIMGLVFKAIQPLIELITGDLMPMIADLLATLLPVLITTIESLLPILNPLIAAMVLMLKQNLAPIKIMLALIVPALQLMGKAFELLAEPIKWISDLLTDLYKGMTGILDGVVGGITDIIEVINPFSSGTKEMGSMLDYLKKSSVNAGDGINKLTDKVNKNIDNAKLMKKAWVDPFNIGKIETDTEKAVTALDKLSQATLESVKNVNKLRDLWSDPFSFMGKSDYKAEPGDEDVKVPPTGGGGAAKTIEQQIEENIKAITDLLIKQKFSGLSEAENARYKILSELKKKNSALTKKETDELKNLTEIQTKYLSTQAEETAKLNNLILITRALKEQVAIQKEQADWAAKLTDKLKIVPSLNIAEIDWKMFTQKSKLQPPTVSMEFALEPILTLDWGENLILELESKIQPLFTGLNEKFNEIFSTKNSKEEQKALKERIAGYKKDAAELKSSLLRKEISLEEYEDRSAELAQNEKTAFEELQDTVLNVTKKIQEALGATFDSIETLFADKFVAALEKAQEANKRYEEESAKTRKNGRAIRKAQEDEAKAVNDALYSTAAAATATFAQVLAAGGNIGEASKSMLATLLDTAQKAVLIYAPQIFGMFASLGLFAIPAGLAAIATMQGLLALAKGAVGADAGVIGIDERYGTKASSRDTIPLLVRKGESILTPEFTDKHKDLLTSLYRGDTEEKYFIEKYGKNINQNYSVPNNDSKLYNKLINTIESGISVKAENFNNIKIVDKTTKGIKASVFR